jgi:probable F420-dependent oxidoreductase
MKFWQSVSFAEAEQLPEIAKIAEEVGFHGIINSEHLFISRSSNSAYPYSADGKMNHEPDEPTPDVWTSFAAMAAVTTKLQFTPGIYLLPLRNPIEVAKVAGTCALISNNRVAVGFGVGWQKEEFDAMGVDFQTRGRRTDEMIEVMRKLWRGGVVSHHGKFFQFSDIQMQPVPTKPLPFYCGGTSPAALRRAATLCDGYIGPGHNVEDIPAFVAELKRLRREAGRDHLPFEIILFILPLTDCKADVFKRVEDMGVTGVYLPPFDLSATSRGETVGLGRRSRIDQKRRVMEQSAEDIIRKVN